MLEGRGEEQADTGPGWRVPAPVSPGSHPSHCCLEEPPSGLLTPPGSETSQNRAAGAGCPGQSQGWGLPRPPSGSSHGGAQVPVAVTRPWALPAGRALSSPRSLEGKSPHLPQEPPEPRSRNCSAQLTPPPQVSKPPAHHQQLACLTDQCSQLDPHGLPPALLGAEALHTPPTPEAGPSHAYSHHPHASRDVQRMDGDAVEEARDCTSWKEKHTSRSRPGEAAQGDGSRRREKPFRLSPRLSSQHPDVCPRIADPSEASTRLHGPVRTA